MKAKIRIAGTMDTSGRWSTCGYGNLNAPPVADEELMESASTFLEGHWKFFIEAEVELPEVQTIQGVVK